MIFTIFTSSCLICSSWSLSTDFVLTTLAMRCQTSDNNWQKRHIRSPCHCWSRLATYLIDPCQHGRDKQCKGRTKHGRKERIHWCHHWVDPSMTLGRTGQRTIGWRRHGWALKVTWKRKTTDHTKLWDPECHQSANNVRFFQSTSRQEDPCSTCVMSLKQRTLFHYFSFF